MNTTDGNFSKLKKILVFISAIGVLYASIVFSKNGFQFNAGIEYGWIGWLLAIAATSSEFMVTSSFKKINWTILALGMVGYIYSIWSNVQGFQSLRSQAGIDLLSFSASIFMDIYPEVAISWVFGESKFGDLFGNLIQSATNPDALTKQGAYKNSVTQYQVPAYKPPSSPYPYKPATVAKRSALDE